jgi:hypothetical protein
VRRAVPISAPPSTLRACCDDYAGRVDPADVELRNATYRRFVELGRGPTAAEMALLLGQSEDETRDGWRRLHDGHALVLDEAGAIRMANPFSAVPTPFVVHADGRDWFANCAWDAFGIGAAMGVDIGIDCACPDCQQAIRLTVRDGMPDDTTPVFHVLVPAVTWWQDIGFT